MSVYKKKGSPYWQFDFQYRGHRFYGSTKTARRRRAVAIERAERKRAKQIAATGESLLNYEVLTRRQQSAQNHLPEARRKFLAFIKRGVESACYLYRHYHPNGDFLYVGISLNVQERHRAHFKGAS